MPTMTLGSVHPAIGNPNEPRQDHRKERLKLLANRAASMFLEAHIISYQAGRNAPIDEDWHRARDIVDREYDAINEAYRLMREGSDKLLSKSSKTDLSIMAGLNTVIIVGAVVSLVLLFSLLANAVCQNV